MVAPVAGVLMCACPMDGGALQIDPQQLVELVLAALGALTAGGLGYAVVRRARRARQRQIEALGASEPAVRPRPERRRVEPVPEPEDSAVAAEPDASTAAAEPAPTDEAEPETPDTDAGTAQDAQVIPFPTTPARPRDAGPPTVEVPAPTLPEKPKAKAPSALAPGLARTRAGWVARLGQLFTGKKEIDPALLDEVEKVLLTADIGVRTSQKLLEDMRASLSRAELTDGEAVWTFLRKRTEEILRLDAPPVDWTAARPFVLLIIGVNGSGKTTTIGKLASKLMADGKKVLLGAGDTFRAAATEQLEIWANRVGAPLVKGREGADPASVLFDAVKRAKAESFDVVICDTAGRLHTKTDLMGELQKVGRVIGKAAEGAPHETWLVIDSTSGQNAVAQAQIFTQAMAVSGIVLTKLDGTAKGGVVIGITDQLRIPVRYIGVGERVDDLRAFDAEEFVEALYTREDEEKN